MAVIVTLQEYAVVDAFELLAELPAQRTGALAHAFIKDCLNALAEFPVEEEPLPNNGELWGDMSFERMAEQVFYRLRLDDESFEVLVDGEPQGPGPLCVFFAPLHVAGPEWKICVIMFCRWSERTEPGLIGLAKTRLEVEHGC